MFAAHLVEKHFFRGRLMLEFICGFLLALLVMHYKEQQYTNYIHGMIAGSLAGGALFAHFTDKRAGDEERGLPRNLADLFKAGRGS